MSTMGLMLCVALGIMLLALVSIALVAIWVYRDARSRGLEAWVWTLVVVLVPSFIGLLLYFLVGRRETRRACPACARQVPARSTFCGYCGAPLPEELPRETKRSHGKGMLIAGLVCLVLTIVLGFAAVLGLALSDGAFVDADFFSVSTVYVENNWGNEWNVSFHYTNKTPDASFRIRDDGPDTLSFEGRCEEGPLTLRVWQGDVARTFDLSGGDEVEGSLDLSVFTTGKVYMELDNRRGEGTNVKFKAHWERGAAPAAADTTVPAAASPLAEEAAFLIKTIEESHPAFALDAVPEGYERAKAELLTVEADPACTTADFAWAAQAYTASLKDGHTAVDIFGGTPQQRVDLDWYADGEHLYLTDGDEVKTIGGLSVADLFAAVDRYVPAENQASRDQNHENWAGLLSFLHYVGAQMSADYKTVAVTLADGGAREAEFVTPKAGMQEKVVTTELLGDVLYVDFNQCRPGAEVNGACEELAQAVKDGVSKVILDVRGNGGGDSSTCERLLAAIGMSAPSYGGYLRYSPLAREQRGYDKSEGSESSGPSLSRAKANPAVKLAVLTDEGTFSSATMLAVMVRDGKLGAVIGRTSSNAPNSFGDILSFQLPETGMTVTVSHKRWLRPDENGDPENVTPDIVTAHGEDSLQAALDYLKE